jgi:uncharacterized protein YjbI with pentapeptide repeats
MKIEIKDRFNGKVLFAHDQENNSVKATLEAGIKAKADLSYADLNGANLNGAYLNGAYLGEACMSGAYMCDAYLKGAYLGGTNLNNAYLSYADLNGAYLGDADLNGAHLEGAYLGNADLSGACLNGAKLNSADLETATYGEGVIIGNNPLFILGLTWPVYIFKNHIKIGCQIHTKQEWLNFSDADIAKMESHASEFWAKWKKHILWMAFEGNKPKAGSVG